jgi:UDPglucose--hexose-1-phosphate uridylyltransferase
MKPAHLKGEVRQDKVTKEWVIFAPGRGLRPHDFKNISIPKPERPSYVHTCPFCSGNESRLEAILFESASFENGGWQTRVVPNLYPALTNEGNGTRKMDGIYLSMDGFGSHEVVIDSPLHNESIASMDAVHVRSLIDTYHARYNVHHQDQRNQLILIFRNSGPRAGASMEHPHSQIVSAGFIPRWIRWRNFEAQRYFDELGRCVYCDILAYEGECGKRVIFENGSFLSFIPYAAEVPFEVWILPKRHHPSFGQITDAEKTDLAAALHFVMRRLAEKLNDPDYNYIIYSSSRYGIAPQLHWYLRVRPRLVTRAGFEIGSGMRINPSLPELDAAFLTDRG